MGGVTVVLWEVSLVALSLLLTIGYHAYLCHQLRRNPGLTTIGINFLRRRAWVQPLNQGDDKKGMLAVQSLRNTLMGSILTATVTIIITLSLAALINNVFNALNHLRGTNIIFIPAQPTFNTTTMSTAGGSSGGVLIAIKYGSAFMLLMTSFMCSSMGISYLMDANFLVNALGHFMNRADEQPSGVGGTEESSSFYTEGILEKGFTLVGVGNRVLCITLPLVLWMFGPLPMLVSSIGLVWVLYQLDFPPRMR